MWADTILILFISICTALLGEGKAKTAENFADQFNETSRKLMNYSI